MASKQAKGRQGCAWGEGTGAGCGGLAPHLPSIADGESAPDADAAIRRRSCCADRDWRSESEARADLFWDGGGSSHHVTTPVSAVSASL